MFPETLTINDDTLKYQHMPEALILFLMTSVMSGVFALIQGGSAWLNANSQAAVSASQSAHAFWLALLCIITGAFCLFYREGFTIDRKAGTISIQNGEPGFYRAKTFLLADVATLIFSNITFKPGKGSEFPAFVLRLKIRDQDIRVLFTKDEFEARQMARQIAEFAGVPHLDTGGQKLRPGNPAIVYPPPPRMRSIYSINGDDVVIEISPAKKFTAEQIMNVAIFSCLFAGLIYLTFSVMSRPLFTSKETVAAIICFSGIFILAGFFYLELKDVLARRFETVILEASPAALRVRRKRPAREVVIEIPVPSIKQIHFWNEKSLWIDSRNGVEVVGAGLKREELEWIRAMLINSLSRSPELSSVESAPQPASPSPSEN